MGLHRLGTAFAVVFVAAALAACGGGGGGGGGGSVPGGGGGGIVATPTPAAAVALLTPTSAGSLSSSILPGSADGVFTVEAASTPTEPPSGNALTTYTASIKETAGVGTSSAIRAAQSARTLQAIAQNRQALVADRLRERTSDVSASRRLMTRLSSARMPEGGVRRTQAAAGTVGQQRQFKIQTSNIGNSGGCAAGSTSGQYVCFATITATLEAVGAHGNIWVDNASLATQGEYTNVPGEFQTIASRFDGYYATETAAFGPAFYPSSQPVLFTFSSAKPQCDSSGNVLPANQRIATDLTGSAGTSIDVVITDALAGTGEGGYYTVVNEVPQTVWDCDTAPKQVSNNTSMVVVTGDNYSGLGAGIPAQNETYWLNTDIPRSVSHELQHLLHAHYKYFRPIATQTGSGSFDDTFIDEGMSMLAEDLAADGNHIDTPRYSFSFLLEPSLFSLTSFAGYQPNPTSTASNPPYGWYSNTAGSYGQAYLFQRYLYDRFGSGALTAIYNSSATGVGPVLAAANGESFAQLYREFSTAVAAQSTTAASLPYAFSSAIVLRGNVDVPSIRTGSQSTRHLGFGGPQPPEIFANNLPNGFLTLGPGTTASTMLIDGATLFLPSANGSSGTSINVTVPGVPVLEGSLLQGTLPTPPPTST